MDQYTVYMVNTNLDFCCVYEYHTGGPDSHTSIPVLVNQSFFILILMDDVEKSGSATGSTI